LLKLTSGKVSSNILNIKAEPSGEAEKRALELLSDPNCYNLLDDGKVLSGAVAERRQHLEGVFNQCADTLIGKWAGARVGIELVEELGRKYSPGEEFMRAYRKGEVKEPLVKRAYNCLSAGLDLPDGFPIREEVLLNMVNVEIIKGDYQRCVTYANELGLKYPAGRFGSKAAELLSDIERLKVEEPREGSEANVTENVTGRDKHRNRHILGVLGGAGVIAVVIAGLVVLGDNRGK